MVGLVVSGAGVGVVDIARAWIAARDVLGLVVGVVLDGQISTNLFHKKMVNRLANDCSWG